MRWPLGGIGRLWSGVAALALSWAIGTGAYFLFVNLDAVQAAERAAAGLRNPGGPIPAPDFGSALIAVGVWQALFFIALVGPYINAVRSYAAIGEYEFCFDAAGELWLLQCRPITARLPSA